ncbi:MAG: methylmalonyl-CoA epimerase [Deltaproteobacteria bacterium]|nr:methylmalonyl-CoA epimerase [Deltaproteobacteria bacterium]
MPRARKVDHIGIAVPDLKAAEALFERLLGKGADRHETVEDQKVTTAFFAIGETSLELLQATDPESPIARFLKKNGRGGIHHICFEVEGIEEILARYKRDGVQLIDEKPRIGAHGKKIAFIHPKSTGGVLIELSEPSLSEEDTQEER